MVKSDTEIGEKVDPPPRYISESIISVDKEEVELVPLSQQNSDIENQNRRQIKPQKTVYKKRINLAKIRKPDEPEKPEPSDNRICCAFFISFIFIIGMSLLIIFLGPIFDAAIKDVYKYPFINEACDQANSLCKQESCYNDLLKNCENVECIKLGKKECDRKKEELCVVEDISYFCTNQKYINTAKNNWYKKYPERLNYNEKLKYAIKFKENYKDGTSCNSYSSLLIFGILIFPVSLLSFSLYRLIKNKTCC